MLAQSYLVSIQQLLASSQEQIDVIGEIAAKIAKSIIAGGNRSHLWLRPFGYDR